MGTLMLPPPHQIAKAGYTLASFVLIWIICTIPTVAQDGSCDLQGCWNRYMEAESYYQPDTRGVSDAKARKCITERTYLHCLENLPRSACSSKLDYQGARTGWMNKMGELNCRLKGRVYPEGPEQLTPQAGQFCNYNLVGTHSFCSLFGDPHLSTFWGIQQTCRLTGAWPMVDNEYLTVQVSNSPVQPGSTATATTKLTVVIKAQKNNRDAASGEYCGSKKSVFYRAEAGFLPGVFQGGQREHGAYSSISIETIEAGQQVEIYIRYIDTTVIVRQLDNQYLSVGIRMPDGLINGTIIDRDGTRTGSQQLCVDECPTSDRIDFGQFVNSRTITKSHISEEEAQRICRATSATDFYFDSCVFDIMMTGQRTFSSAANAAYEDVIQYSSRQPNWANRTSLDIYKKRSLPPVDPGDSGDDAPSNSSMMTSSLFVYIMHVLVSLIK